MNVPRLVLPLLVIVAIFGGYVLRLGFTQPSTEAEFGAAGRSELTCIVDGVRCQGTAAFFTRLYENEPGIGSIVTFATEKKAVFTYDPSVITPDRIREVMEAEIPLLDGTRRQVFKCLSME